MQNESGLFAFFDLFNRGGWVMYLILAVSIYVVGVILYKFWQFSRLGITNPEAAQATLAQISGPGAGGKAIIPMLLARLDQSRHPASRMLAGALRLVAEGKDQDAVREEITRTGAREIAALETHIRGLELASNLAPLLGLLGMVLSMVRVFSAIEAAGARVDVTLLAGGIWEALLTTVFGLIVAVVAQVGFYLLDTRIERTQHLMNDAGAGLLQWMKNKPEATPHLAPGGMLKAGA